MIFAVCAVATLAAATACGVGAPTAAPAPAATPAPAIAPADTPVRQIGPVATPPTALPPFALPMAGGGVFDLADYLGKQPVVVIVYRGLFCSICREQLADLERFYDTFKREGAELVAFSTDTLADAETTVRTLGLSFPVLADTDGLAAKSWGIFNTLGDGVATPSTFVFDATGQLRGFRIGRDAADRPHPSEVLDFLRSFNREGAVSAPGTPTLGVASAFEIVFTSPTAANVPTPPAPTMPAAVT